MRKSIKSLWWVIGFFFSLPPLTAQTESDPPLIGAGTYLYLRCNSTSWDVNEMSRLEPSGLNFLRELSFEVRDFQMTEAGDDCVITETPARDAWGAWQKSYGGQLSSLRVPESSILRLQTDPNESVNFKLRFPTLGRYRFILNTRDGYFSVRKDAVPEAGDVAWTLPGNILSDDLGRLFLSNYYPKNSLSLVDAQTGLPQWTYKSETYISFYGKCSTADTVFVTTPGRVAALSLKTGAEIWSKELNATPQDTYGYLNCFTGHDEIYLSYGSTRTTLVSLQRSTGKTLWSWTAPAYASIMGVDSGRLLITNFHNATMSLKALDKNDGLELWQMNSGTGYFSLAEDGALFLVDGDLLTAIAPESGLTLWNYRGQQNDTIWLSLEQNGLYVHEKARISAFDKKTGRKLWVYDYSSFADQYPYAQILKAGVTIVRVNDYNANVSRQIALNSFTGTVLWEREEPSASSFLNEDNQSGTWVITGKTMRAMDPWTGKTRWTYTLPSNQPWENIMNVLEVDDSTVYAAYGMTGSKFPPMGVLALDVATGSLQWQTWMESSIYRVGGDRNTLILNAGYYGSTKALKK